jgi:WD40 repeat protein
MKKIIFCFLFILFCTFNLYCQVLNLYDIDKSIFPNLKAKLLISDTNGAIIKPSINDLILRENNLNRIITNISCPENIESAPISIAISIDVSGSMYGLPIDWAKETSTNLVNLISNNESEIAIQKCDDIPVLLQDLTVDRELVKQSISSIESTGGTNFPAQLLDANNGVFNIIKKGQYKKIVVLCTDAYFPALSAEILQRCKDTCEKYNITFYAIIYSQSNAGSAGVKSSLIEIARSSGGIFFDGVTSVNAANELGVFLSQITQNLKPCTIEWLSETVCDTNEVLVDLIHSNGSSDKEKYKPEKVPILKFTPNSVFFKNIKIGTPKDTIIKIYSQYFDFDITSISSSNPQFSVTPNKFVLNAGETVNLTVRYTPVDSGYNWTKFSIVSNLCNSAFFASGGFAGKKAKTKTLKLEFPNGNEKLYAGCDTVIKWSGIPESDPVKIEYQVNKNAPWITICPQASGLNYKWTNIPYTPSSQCIAKITQIDLAKKDEAKMLRTFTGHQYQLIDLVWCSDGTRLASLDANKTIKIWDATNLNEYISKSFNTQPNNFVWTDDGSFIINTRTNYNGIDIWNTSNGDVYINPLNSGGTIVSFSCLGSPTCFVIGDVSHNVKYWDDTQGMNLNTIHTFPYEIIKSQLSPDKKFIAVSSNNTLFILDVLTHSIKKQTSGFSSDICNINWNNTSTNIVTITKNGEAKLWDVSNNTNSLIGLVAVFPGAFKSISGNVFSPDNSLIALTYGSGFIGIFNASGDEITEFKKHSKPINNIEWSSDSQFLLSSSDDSTAKVYNIKKQELEYSLIGHTAEVVSAKFNPTNDLIATAGKDNKVIIWSFEPEYLQDDESDKVWSIIGPVWETDDLELGSQYINEPKDTLVGNYIRNKGQFPIQVTNIAFKGNDANAFNIISGYPPFSVEPNSDMFSEFRFHPNKLGIHKAQMVITTNTETITKDVTGYGISSQLKIINSSIDLERIVLTESKDTIAALTITNTGNTAIDISNIVFSGPNTTDFSILAGAQLRKLEPGDTAKIDIRFIANKKGRTNSILEYHYNGLGSPARILVLAEGINMGPSIEILSNDNGILLCEKTADYQLEIKNTGGSPLSISNFYIEGINADEFITTSDYRITIKPDSIGKLTYRFRPNSVGIKIAEAVIVNNSTDNPIYRLPISAEKQSTEYEVDLTNIPLGSLLPNKEWQGEINIKNTGSKPNKFIIENSEHFSSEDSHIIIDENKSKNIKLHFSGISLPGNFSESITITDTACSVQTIINLHGTIDVGPLVQSSIVKPIDLGCEIQALDSVEIVNSGNENLHIESVAISDNINYELIGSYNNKDYEPGKGFRLYYKFRPQAIGDFPATILIKNNSKPAPEFTIGLNCTKRSALLVPESYIVNLGELCPGQPLDTFIIITNHGNTEATIGLSSSTNISLDDNSASISEDNNAKLHFVFAGFSSEKDINEFITVTDEICNTSYNIQITGKVMLPKFEIENLTINAVIGSSKSDNLLIRNLSNRNINISTIPTINSPFSINPSEFPINLSALESKNITITYKAENSNESNAQIELISDECNIKASVNIYGKPENSKITLRIENTQCNIGDIIDLPVYFDNPENIAFEPNTIINAKAKYDITVLSALDKEQTILDNNKAEISLNNLSLSNIENGIITNLKFKAGLGSADSSIIDINTAEIIGANLTVNTKDAVVKIANICNEGGKRLINPNAKNSIQSISPNPAETDLQITYNICEKQAYKLYLVSSLGEKIDITEINDNKTGEKTCSVNINKLSAGYYLIILETYAEKIVKPVLIFK